jgi:hypothetical protein
VKIEFQQIQFVLKPAVDSQLRLLPLFLPTLNVFSSIRFFVMREL